MFQHPSEDVSFAAHDTESANGHDDVETVVGPSVHVEGDFVSAGNILVKGTVSGSVKTSKRLTVEDGAKIHANVTAGSAIISGEVRGNVEVDDMVELRATARIMGDVECSVLVVEAGCLIYGKVAMKGLSEETDRGEKKRVASRRERAKGILGEMEESLA